MDPIQRYRNIARLKHEQTIGKKSNNTPELQENIKEKSVLEKSVSENVYNDKPTINENELNLITYSFINLDDNINNLEYSNDLILLLNLIYSEIESVFNLIQKHKQLEILHEKILIMIQKLNIVHENNKYSLLEINETKKIMDNICKLCKIDVDIELMDTSKDDECARKLQETMYNEYIVDDN